MPRDAHPRRRSVLGVVGTVLALTVGVLPALAVLPATPALADVTSVTPTSAANTAAAKSITVNLSGYVIPPSSVSIQRSGTADAAIDGTNVSGTASAVSATFNLVAAAPGDYDVTVAPGPLLTPSETCAGCLTITGSKPTVTKVNGGSSVSATGGDKVVTVTGTNLANKATVAIYKAGVLDTDVTATVGTVTSLTSAPLTLHFPHGDAESGKRTVTWTNTDDQTDSCACLTIAGSVAGTKPAKPTGVTALPGNRSAQVSWTAAGDGHNVLTGYRIDAAPGTAHVTVGPQQTSGIVPGLNNGTGYTFTVVAINGIGKSAPGGPTSVVTPHAPKVRVSLPKTVTAGTPSDFTVNVTNDTITAYPKAKIALTITGLPALTKDRVSLVDTNGGVGVPVALKNKNGAVVATLPSTGTFALGAGTSLTRPFAITLDPAAPAGALFIIATVVDASQGGSPVDVSADSDNADVNATTTRYQPINPLRFVDTHNGVGLSKGRHAGDATITVPPPPHIPADAQSVVLDITVADPSRNGSLQVFPAGGTAGNRALSYRKGHDESQVTVTRFSAKRKITLRLSNGSAHFVVSVLGYETNNGVDGGRFVAVSPRTIGDTSGGAIPSSRTVHVRMPAVVPHNVAAVLVDVTAVHTRSAGTVKVYPKGGSAPIAVAVNFAKGAAHTGAFLTRVGRDNSINLEISGRADVVVDLVGYYAVGRTYAGRFQAIKPTLVLNAPKSGTVDALMPPAVPDGARAAVMTVTAHAPSAAGALRAYASGAAEPATTVLSWAKGQDASAMVVAAIGDNGKVRFHVRGGSTRLQVEVIGYLTG